MAGKMGQTVTVFNQSGKIIKESKNLVNVFKEARSAYRERKAEIKAVRDAEFDERRARHAVRTMTIKDDDAVSRAPSRASRAHSKTSHAKRSEAPKRSSTHHQHHSRKPPTERGISDTPLENHGRDMAETPNRPLVRRHTEAVVVPPKQTIHRSRSDEKIDMDLAYGYLPPPLPVARVEDEAELKLQASKLTKLLDEANCLQHSATTMIENLQKNPDALASCALTLAEISGLVGKLAPGVLKSLRASFPAVVALLASPQFLIAAGVGVGVTVVALGGFKVIKRIQEEKTLEEPQREVETPYQLDELNAPELSRIEMWRRGIADAEAESMGTTVDGEFVTPGASKYFIAHGVLDDDHKSRKSKAPKSVYSVKTTKTSKTAKTSRTNKTSKTHHSSHSRSEDKDRSGKERSGSRSGEKKRVKVREPSGLRMLFS